MWPFDAVNWLALSIPFAYLFILIGSLTVFSNLYRKRQAATAASLAPWFPPHLHRNIYLTLLHQENPKVPDSILKAALLRRATEDIHRIVQVRNAKQALQVLLQRGSVGDDLWQRFQRAEKEIEEELRDVVNEANAFAPNWGTTIFQSASEMAQNAHIRERLAEIQATAPAEKEWWEKRRTEISSNFMKELDEEKKSPTATEAASGKPAAKTGSDDDAVIVEAGGPTVNAGKGKKKKAKH
ncbi:translocation protein-like protein sec66 [Lindgomyces ingoldianus]|uniref:Translocation protein-like protein sec66 n=1 Tax=Lindgomyces ingoldianus TaxID=673940 RepID=A0ACB6QME5_9PLEO|nr:translocation protein-like protein sec66 [Lindgomyces ingoldianus]KAF2468071.1 translocation protein-like protein sec66 [Lindgomyces ingoldianus]